MSIFKIVYYVFLGFIASPGLAHLHYSHVIASEAKQSQLLKDCWKLDSRNLPELRKFRKFDRGRVSNQFLFVLLRMAGEKRGWNI